ncbi:MAG TPA: hypothetical protein VFS92_03020, partial [Planctomycetota bacterium]|nr:hypothetical protein [Planctomycetota bacterium]
EKTALTVTVELAASGDGAGVARDSLVHRVQVYLAPGAKRRLTIPVVSRGAGTSDEWVLTVRTQRRTLLRHGTRFEDGRSLKIDLGALAGVTTNPGNVDPSAPILGVLGDPGNRLGWLGTIAEEEQRREEVVRLGSGGLALNPKGGRRTAVPGVLAISPESAPDTWIAYEGFDAVIWVDPDPASMPDPAQVDALLEWTLNGGRLVVALTPAARIPAGSALARALPAEAIGFDEVPSDRLLSALAGSSKGVRAGNVPVARLGPLQGRVVKADAEGRTLVARRDAGLGTVTVLAFDPRLLSGAAPGPRGELLRLVMGPLVWIPGDDGSQHYGGSLERLEDHLRRRFVRTPPLLVLVLGLALYVLAIGPVDYLVLKRRNRLRRTVVTFPLIVIGFTVAAYGASFLLFGAAGGQARVAILDFATTPGKDADAVRGLDFLGTYSPVGRTLEVRWPAPRSFVSGPWASPAGWQWGMGGGMAGSLAGSVEFAPDGRPSATVDIPLRSYRTIQARFSGEVASSLDADILLRDGQRILRATNRLKRKVRDLWAVEPGTGGTFTARLLGDLEAGATAEYTLARIPGSVVGQTPGLPDPFQDAAGLYSRNTAGWGDGDAFVPQGSSEAAQDRARAAVAKALLGASVGGLDSRAETRSVRSVARQGLDISRGVREGRVLLMGWCDGDPVGGLLPDDGDLKSTVVAVRRLLPAEEAR